MVLKKNFNIVFVRGLYTVSQIAILKTIASFLGADDVGEYFYYLTIFSIISVAILNPIDMHQQTIALDYFKESNSFYEFFKFNANLTISIFLVASLFIYLADYILISIPSVYYVSLILELYIIQNFRSLLNITGFDGIVNKSLVLESLAKPIIVLILMYNNSNLNSYLLGLNISYAIIITFILIYLKNNKLLNKYRCSKNFNHNLKNYIYECYHNSINGILSLAQNQGFRLVLGFGGFYEILGLYSLLAGVGQSILAALASIYYQSQIPKLYKNIDRYFKPYILNALLIFLSFGIIIFILRNELTSLLISNKYLDHSYLIFIGFIIEALQIFMGAISIFCNIKKFKKLSIIIYLITTILTLIFSFIQYYYSINNVNIIPAILMVPQILALTLFFIYYNVKIIK